MHGANGILYVYDITNKESFHRLKNWLNDSKGNVSPETEMIIVGNKIDLEENRVVSKKEAEDFATEKGFLFYEVSAKTGEQIEELFNTRIFPEMARKYNIGDEEEEAGENGKENGGNDNKGVKLNDTRPAKKKGGCCGGGKKKGKNEIPQNQEGEGTQPEE